MSFTLAHLSDAHLSPAPFPSLKEFRLKRFMGYVNWKRGRQGLNDMAMLGRLTADMLAHKPDHVAMTGDVVNIALRIEFQRAAEWLKTLGASDDVSFTPGNHDAYVRDAMTHLTRAFAPWTRGDDGAESFPYLRRRGDVAIIGLNSGLPTAPLLASGRLGEGQLARLALLLDETGAQGLARVVLIHHPPLSGGRYTVLRGLNDAAAFERVIAEHGAEAILHGHSHKRMLNWLPSRATRHESGKTPVIGAPSCSAATDEPRHAAGYYLLRFERRGEAWRIHARERGLMGQSRDIVEREPLQL